MVIYGSLSGIQDYLLNVKEEGGGQARQMRARSFRIQLVAECVALRFRLALGLSEDDLLLCAAQKFALRCSLPPAHVRRRVAGEVGEIDAWLLGHTRGQLRLATAVEEGEGADAGQYEAALRRLQRAKLRAFSSGAAGEGGWDPSRLCLPQPLDLDVEAEDDKALGVLLPDARWLVIEAAQSAGPAGGAAGGARRFDVAGLSVSLRRQEPGASEAYLSCGDLRPEGGAAAREGGGKFRGRRLARHVPVEGGRPVEFVELAARARGAALLGVLKADVDDLGRAVGRRLEGAADLRPLREFSGALDDFFAGEVDAELRRPEWSNLYTIFGGGDDLLLVGPWDLALDFAAHLRGLFARRFPAGELSGGPSAGLTLSAGLAIIKAKLPIKTAVRQADGLLASAKEQAAPRAARAKDQFAVLGAVWKWSDHAAVVGAGKRLAGWVDRKVVQRAWLHTLLELALLRGGGDDGGGGRGGVNPALADSRLAYHVARNWPRPNDHNPDPRAAGLWAERLSRQFEKGDRAADAEAAYLPAVLRYAMLATRGE